MPVIDNSNPKQTGRVGGLLGGHARKEALTPKRRKQIASDAAKARWTKRLWAKTR